MSRSLPTTARCGRSGFGLALALIASAQKSLAEGVNVVRYCATADALAKTGRFFYDGGSAFYPAQRTLIEPQHQGGRMLRQDIKDIAQPLQIPFLVHFTRVINLEAIMKHGLYPKSRIHEIDVTPHINDQHRHDGHLDSTSLSINFPNYLMFHKYSQDDLDEKWVILKLPAYILWRKNCAFCRYNAAKTSISTTPIEDLKTPQAFLDMFEDDGTREGEALKAYDPTDEQAEVLVFDVIEPRHIKYAVFNDRNVMAANVHLLGDCEPSLVGSRKGLFGTRGYSRKFGG